MLFTADDLAIFYDLDLGAVEATLRPCAGGAPIIGFVHLRAPGIDLFNGAVATTDYTLRYPTATFPRVAVGDRITIGRTDYQVRDVPQPVADGLEATVSLAKL